MFDFYLKVIKGKSKKSDFIQIENVRNSLLQNNYSINSIDYGAGSRILNSNKSTSVKQIARSALSTTKYCQLYARIIQYFNCKQILELGTSLGISTLYFANATQNGKVTTLEGNPEIATLANHNFENLGINNINLLIGKFEDQLKNTQILSQTFDFVFIDGHHKHEPTIQYFKELINLVHSKSIIIIDDIHWSSDMEQAWEEIQQIQVVTVTIDLFFCGIIFIDPNLSKQHFVLKF
ncbi:MAG: class I SAM-dependent methyltransferase [Bacteroidota bacterium]|nr:class I SAM-dependent methyltransferase [Bacteroidota bacterium]